MPLRKRHLGRVAAGGIMTLLGEERRVYLISLRNMRHSTMTVIKYSIILETIAIGSVAPGWGLIYQQM